MKLPFVEKEKSDEKIIRPENWGWIEKKLDQSSIDYLWRCIDKKGEKIKDNLIFAHVDEVYLLLDRGDWFFHHVVEPLALDYEREFGNGLSTSIPDGIYLIDNLGGYVFVSVISYKSSK